MGVELLDVTRRTSGPQTGVPRPVPGGRPGGAPSPTDRTPTPSTEGLRGSRHRSASSDIKELMCVDRAKSPKFVDSSSLRPNPPLYSPCLPPREGLTPNRLSPLDVGPSTVPTSFIINNIINLLVLLNFQ